jgi:putative transposase
MCRREGSLASDTRRGIVSGMAEFIVLIFHILKTLITLLRPGGVYVVMAESVAIKQQLQVVRRSQKRAPRLTCWDRMVFGLCAFFISAKRLPKCAVIVQPPTFLRLHRWLVKGKYRWLYSSTKPRKPGPKGPSPELIRAVLEMKLRNPRMGCRKVAEQLSRAFGIEVNKDVVRRILAKAITVLLG